MDDGKKTAAAIAAVMAYIKSEEECGCMQATVPVSENLYHQLHMLYQQLRLMFG
jgi:hypothetical protein